MVPSLAKLPVWDCGIQMHQKTIIIQRLSIMMVRSTGKWGAPEEKQLTRWEASGMPSRGAETQSMARKQPGEMRWARALFQLGTPGQTARPWVSGRKGHERSEQGVGKCENIRGRFIGFQTSIFQVPHLSTLPCVLAVLSCFSRVWLFAILWTVAHQAPLSMGFSGQEYWSGLPCPSPSDFPNPGTERTLVCYI